MSLCMQLGENINLHLYYQMLAVGWFCFNDSRFYHEQSRTDRDDYVEINWANIPEDKQGNFRANDWSYSTVLDEPYDYESVMHYSKA